MDTFVDSTWYFMRYCDPQLDTAMVGKGTAYWMPMDQYIGGIEHAILHLLYARFWTKVMRDLKLVAFDEPFTHLLTQGMVLNHVYSRRTDKGGIEYFWPDDVEPMHAADGRIAGAVLKKDGSRVDYDGVGTMSKSKNNGVDPQALIDRYGADTARLFVMFAAPPEQTLEWNDAGVEGAHRFLRRLWTFGMRHAETLRGGARQADPADRAPTALRFEVHTVLGQIGYDYERLQYNTVVSGAMKLLNALEGFQGDAPAAAARVLRHPAARALPGLPARHARAVAASSATPTSSATCIDAPWPQVDKAALVQDWVELVLQINGKLRGTITVAPNASKKSIETAALASPEFKRFSEGRPPRKIVIVPGRLVNVVV